MARRSSGRTISARAINCSVVSFFPVNAGSARTRLTQAATAAASRSTKIGTRMRIVSLSFGFDCDQAVASLPLLVRIVPGRRLEEAVIILRRRLVFPQVVVSAGPQEVANRKFR